MSRFPLSACSESFVACVGPTAVGEEVGERVSERGTRKQLLESFESFHSHQLAFVRKCISIDLHVLVLILEHLKVLSSSSFLSIRSTHLTSTHSLLFRPRSEFGSHFHWTSLFEEFKNPTFTF